MVPMCTHPAVFVPQSRSNEVSPQQRVLCQMRGERGRSNKGAAGLELPGPTGHLSAAIPGTLLHSSPGATYGISMERE